MTKLFTEDEVIRLCSAIRSQPSLYDPSNANFGKTAPNKAIWEDIAALFAYKHFTPDDVKLKWKNLRDTMALLLRKSNRDPSTWRFYEHCSFINKYERPLRKNGRKRKFDAKADMFPENVQPVAPNQVDLKEEVSEETSRDTNFDDNSRDSLMHQLMSQMPAVVHSTVKSPVPNNTPPQSQPQVYPARNMLDCFGEVVGLRLRGMEQQGHRKLCLDTRIQISRILDEAEAEMLKLQDEKSQNGCLKST